MALNDKLITYGNLSTFYDNLKSHDLADKQDKLTAGDNVTIEGDEISVDLSEYAEKSELPTKLTDLTNDGNFVQDASYVHTDNNYTTAEKNKLAGIAAGAEVNVQADWNVSDSSSDAFIKNKPQNLVQDASYVHTDNNFTTAEKTKLAGLENYELPQASANTLGGIKVGANLSIDWDGVLSAEDSDAIVDVDTLPAASDNTNKFYRLSTDEKVYMSVSGGSAPSDSAQIDNAYFQFYIEDARVLWNYMYKGAVDIQCSNGTVTAYRWYTEDTSYFTKLSATDQVIEEPYLSSFLGAEDLDLDVTYDESTDTYSSTKTVEEVQNLVNTNLAANHDVILHKLEAGYEWKEVATKDQVDSKQDILTAGSNITISGNVISATDTTYSDATTSTSGLMSAADKTKLNGIEANAEVNVIEGVILSDSVSPLTPDANKNVTIPLVSTSNDGLMSAEDKEKLNGLEAYETATTADIEALFAPHPAYNEIWYTSSDGNIVTPYDTNALPIIVSNTYSDGKGVIKFDSELTSIGQWAFRNCSSLTSVTIPDSVRNIGNVAFGSCTSLTSIEIPDSVTSIWGNAFYGCSGLPVENNLRYADTFLVEAVDKTLSTYTIKDGTKWIGTSAFSGCTSLTSIEIPDSVTSIWGNAFQDCSNLPVENNLRYADTFLVEAVDKTLSTYTIKDGTKWIGTSAFRNCSSLTSIVIPNSVTSIGQMAFRDCTGLTSIEFPNSVTSIESWAFYNCTGLTVPVYNEHMFAYMPTSYSGSYTIPNGIESIAGYSFWGCSSLTSVTIPDSVTSIGVQSFYGCSGLTSVTIGNSVRNIGDVAFGECSGLTSVVIPNSVTSIEDLAFRNCSSLTSIEIPDSVTSIKSQTFRDCSGLTSIEIPNNVTRIGLGAFYRCSGLTSATIPDSVRSIEDNAFDGCSGLTSISYTGTVSQYNSITKGTNWHSNVPATVVHCTDGDVNL